MTVSIEEKGNYKTLKFSKTALPAEYAIIEKKFKDPKTGTSVHGEWFLYGVVVHEIKSMNPRTGVMDVTNEVTDASFFTTANLHERLNEVETGVKIKMFKDIIEGQKGEFTRFSFEVLEEASGEKPAATSLTGIDAELKAVKDSGVSIDEVAPELSKRYGMPEAFIKAKFKNL